MVAWCPNYHKDLLLSIASLTVPTGDLCCPRPYRLGGWTVSVSATLCWREKAPGATSDGWRSLLLPTAAYSEVACNSEEFEGTRSFSMAGRPAWEAVSAPLFAPRAVLTWGKWQWQHRLVAVQLTSFNLSVLWAPVLVCNQGAGASLGACQSPSGLCSVQLL